MTVKQPKVYVAGQTGMVGSAIIRELKARGCNNLIENITPRVDLTDQLAVQDFFNKERPDQVYLAAAKVGGILANHKYPADFIYQNLMIQSNIINAAYRSGVSRLLFLGSSCIYPKYANQPMHEDVLLSGYLEPTNEPYAIAKIAGIKLCESYNRQYGTDYRSVMPTNLYGLNDNYHSEDSHVIPGLIRKFHEANSKNIDKVVVWGSGNARREFLYVSDLAKACVQVMKIDTLEYWKDLSPQNSHLNIGSGKDISIKKLSELIAKIVGFRGEIEFNSEIPDGTPQKLMSSSKINLLGWKPKISLEKGLKMAYNNFIKREKNVK